MNNRTVLISGGSIAGPTLAYWLARHGFSPTIVERAPQVRPGGQAVDLRGASRSVAERMGVLDQIRSLAVHEQGMAYVDRSGRRRFEMPVEMFDGAGAVSDVEILRGDLARILHDAASAHTEYLFDDTITALHQHEHGVDVCFERSPTRTFDLVVGADGLHSRIRSIAFGDETHFLHPLGGYAAFLTIPRPEALEDWALVHSMGAGRVAMIRPDRTPGTAKATLMFSTDALEYDRRDLAQQKQIVAEWFADAGWEMPRVLDALPDASDFYLDTLARVEIDHWSRGRITLVGDAVHCGSPLAGHGTALAMVGAYVLAGELAATDGDHVRAFAAYQAQLRDYVTKRQQLPPGGLRAMAPRTRHGIWLRDAYGRLMTTRPMTRLITKAMTTTEDITLRDYTQHSPAAHAPRC